MTTKHPYAVSRLRVNVHAFPHIAFTDTRARDLKVYGTETPVFVYVGIDYGHSNFSSPCPSYEWEFTRAPRRVYGTPAGFLSGRRHLLRAFSRDIEFAVMYIMGAENGRDVRGCWCLGRMSPNVFTLYYPKCIYNFLPLFQNWFPFLAQFTVAASALVENFMIPQLLFGVPRPSPRREGSFP